MTVDRERLVSRADAEANIYDGMGGIYVNNWSDVIEAVFADIAAQGFVIVPRMPSKEMLQAGDPTNRDRAGLRLAYMTMIAAYEGKSG